MKRFTSSPKFENDAAIRRIKSVPQLEVQYLPQAYHKSAGCNKGREKVGHYFFSSNLSGSSETRES